jgi:hypothetical protein
VIDWSLLLMFAGLFIIVAGAQHALLTPDLIARVSRLYLGSRESEVGIVMISIRRSVVFLGMLIGLAASMAVHAQSLDPKKPAALGPGINKGNVDNVKGSHYFFFYGGPGHIEINMAFKELGVFGNPLRQTLSFDFYDDDDKLMSHNAIVSVGKPEQLKTDGDLAKRQRIRLAIIPQQGAIRLGGYYEIQVTGAAEFVGPTVGVSVTPNSSSLLR